jgi:ABC-type Co2+ transport system permease subunit
MDSTNSHQYYFKKIRRSASINILAGFSVLFLTGAALAIEYHSNDRIGAALFLLSALYLFFSLLFSVKLFIDPSNSKNLSWLTRSSNFMFGFLIVQIIATLYNFIQALIFFL